MHISLALKQHVELENEKYNCVREVYPHLEFECQQHVQVLGKGQIYDHVASSFLITTTTLRN